MNNIKIKQKIWLGKSATTLIVNPKPRQNHQIVDGGRAPPRRRRFQPFLPNSDLISELGLFFAIFRILVRIQPCLVSNKRLASVSNSVKVKLYQNTQSMGETLKFSKSGNPYSESPCLIQKKKCFCRKYWRKNIVKIRIFLTFWILNIRKSWQIRIMCHPWQSCRPIRRSGGSAPSRPRRTCT